MDQKISVKIRKREGMLFEGDVYAISSINDIGPFDILFNHANFVANIKDIITVHHDRNTKNEYIISNGIISAKENMVDVFLGI